MSAPGSDVEHDPVELAASLAHDQWCNSMRRAGWRYGDTLDLPGLTHPDLVPYGQLGDETRARYREQSP